MAVQWLSRHWNEAGDAPGLIVIDEAHHALAASYTEMWKRYPAAKKLGVTATPCRLNRRGSRNCSRYWLLRGVLPSLLKKACCLCSIMYPSVPAARSSGSLTVWRNGGRWGLSGERDGCGTEQASRYRAPVPQCQAVCFRQEGMVYAISIEHARRIAEYYSRRGVNAVAVDSKTPAMERKRMVEEFRHGKSRCW